MLKKIGITVDGKTVLAGGFQMADEMGFPLSQSFLEARKYNCVISIPHYFASAIEAGWDDKQTFSRIHESFRDSRIEEPDYPWELICIKIFMDTANKMNIESSARDIGKSMREELENAA